MGRHRQQLEEEEEQHQQQLAVEGGQHPQLLAAEEQRLMRLAEVVGRRLQRLAVEGEQRPQPLAVVVARQKRPAEVLEILSAFIFSLLENLLVQGTHFTYEELHRQHLAVVAGRRLLQPEEEEERPRQRPVVEGEQHPLPQAVVAGRRRRQEVELKIFLAPILAFELVSFGTGFYVRGAAPAAPGGGGGAAPAAAGGGGAGPPAGGGGGAAPAAPGGGGAAAVQFAPAPAAAGGGGGGPPAGGGGGAPAAAGGGGGGAPEAAAGGLQRSVTLIRGVWPRNDNEWKRAYGGGGAPEAAAGGLVSVSRLLPWASAVRHRTRDGHISRWRRCCGVRWSASRHVSLDVSQETALLRERDLRRSSRGPWGWRRRARSIRQSQ